MISPFFRKSGLALATFFVTLASAPAAIVFSGGTSGNPVVLTFTTDVTLTVAQSFSGPANLLGFVLKDAYSVTPQNINQAPATASPTVGGAIQAEIHSSGQPTLTATGYNLWGTAGFQVNSMGPNDFYGFFSFASTVTLVAGDQVVIKAGSITLHNTVQLPTNLTAPESSLGLVDFQFTPIQVPEPSALLLGGLGALTLGWRRRRAA